MKRNLYCIKLTPEEITKNGFIEGDTVVDGYIASVGFIQKYSHREAHDKCRTFGGSIVPYKSDLMDVMTEVSMTQIPENALLHEVVLELEGREEFKDTNNALSERIYLPTVLFDIIGEQNAQRTPKRLSDKSMKQLKELAQLIRTEYFQIITR